MNFSTPAFLVAFPLFLLLYSRLPARFRLPALVAVNLLWYATWGIPWLFLLIAVAYFNYFFSRERFVRHAGAKLVFGMLIGSDLAILFFCRSLRHVLVFASVGQESSLFGLGVPFGVNFYILLILGYLIDRWRGNGEDETFPEFLAYVSFFAIITAGPLERFSAMLRQLREAAPIGRKNIADGAMIFSVGFFKKMALADALRHPVNAVFFSPGVGLGPLLLGGLLNTFRVYADFSAYCDMGRGLARCLNIRLGVNFRPFYYANSPTDFWRRWNITLGTWIRDYVTLPAMLHLGSRLNLYLIVFFSFFLMGIWHGLYWNWLLFGAVNGLLVVIHTWSEKRWGRSHGLAVRWFGCALAFVLILSNGVLSEVTSRVRLAELAGNLSFENGWGVSLTLWRLAYYSAPYLAVIFFLDIWQERSGQQDYILRLAAIPRLAVFVFLLLAGIMLSWSEINPFTYLNL